MECPLCHGRIYADITQTADSEEPTVSYWCKPCHIELEFKQVDDELRAVQKHPATRKVFLEDFF